MTELFTERDMIDFGDVPEGVDALLQQGVAAYRTDQAKADALFRQALAAEAVLGKLAELDSAEVIGWHVVAALAAGVA